MTARQFIATTKLLFLGHPLATRQLHETLLSKVLALPVFSSDALSSIAYATQEILLVLGAAGVAALPLLLPISVAVAALFVIVVLSYRQTVHAYPTGGGAYRVARENLGIYPGLLAAAALLIDYVLTVSVSVTAGTDAILAALPSIQDLRLPLTVAFLAFVTVVNLRGARQSALLFAIPTYGFVGSIYALLLAGFVSCLDGCPQAPSAATHLAPTTSLSLFLILKAFAGGTTALTGVEAISNGVPAFRPPQSRNAATTLATMGAIAVSMFLGISWLAHVTHVVFPQNSRSTAVAQVAQAVFGRGPMFFIVQLMTAAILVLAANTAYQDFPRLSSILARDDYLPRALINRGDRLAFSNGILTLALLAGVLLVVFDADLNRLIQLYLVGVFISFTLSQCGMVARWRRVRDVGWRRRAATNAAGALVTGTVLVVVLATKFLEGAWIVAIAIPLVLVGMRAVHTSYREIEEHLAAPVTALPRSARHRAIILLDRLDESTQAAFSCARSIPGAELSAFWMGSTSVDRTLWERTAPDVPLMPNGSRSPVRHDLSGEHSRHSTGITTLITPLAVALSPLPHVLSHSNRLRRSARAMMLESPTYVRLIEPIVHDLGPAPDGPHPLSFAARVCVLVQSFNAASLTALDFAAHLGADDVVAVHIALDPLEAEQVEKAWRAEQMKLPLDLHDSPFRHFGASLVEYVTGLRREHPQGTIIVVVPEVVPTAPGQSFLYSHTTKAVERAMLDQTGVTIATVPFPVGYHEHVSVQRRPSQNRQSTSGSR